MLKRLSKWIPEVPPAVIPGDDGEYVVPARIGTSDDARRARRADHATEESVVVGDWRIMLEDEPLGPPRLIDPDAGAMQIGPMKVSARFSIVLIFWAVVILNIVLAFGVIVAMLHRAGKL